MDLQWLLCVLGLISLFSPATVDSTWSVVTQFPGLVAVNGALDCYLLILHGIFVVMPWMHAGHGGDSSLARYLGMDLLMANCLILVLVRWPNFVCLIFLFLCFKVMFWWIFLALFLEQHIKCLWPVIWDMSRCKNLLILGFAELFIITITLWVSWLKKSSVIFWRFKNGWHCYKIFQNFILNVDVGLAVHWVILGADCMMCTLVLFGSKGLDLEDILWSQTKTIWPSSVAHHVPFLMG